MYQNIVQNTVSKGNPHKLPAWRGWNRNKRLFQIVELDEPVKALGQVMRFRASNGEPNGYIWATDLDDMDRKLGV